MNDTTKSKNLMESTDISESTNGKENKKHLLSDESYQKLKDLLQQIYEATELSPSMRKLVNALITDKSLGDLHSKLMSQLGIVE